MIKLQSKTAVTYELDNVEDYVQEVYEKISKDHKERTDAHQKRVDEKLENYFQDIMAKVEETKARLLTEEMDFIIKERVKEILAESFGAK